MKVSRFDHLGIATRRNEGPRVCQEGSYLPREREGTPHYTNSRKGKTMEIEVTVHFKMKMKVETTWLPDYESVDPEDSILDQIKAMIEEDIETGDFNWADNMHTAKVRRVTTKAEISE